MHHPNNFCSFPPPSLQGTTFFGFFLVFFHTASVNSRFPFVEFLFFPDRNFFLFFSFPPPIVFGVLFLCLCAGSLDCCLSPFFFSTGLGLLPVSCFLVSTAVSCMDVVVSPLLPPYDFPLFPFLCLPHFFRAASSTTPLFDRALTPSFWTLSCPPLPFRCPFCPPPWACRSNKSNPLFSNQQKNRFSLPFPTCSFSLCHALSPNSSSPEFFPWFVSQFDPFPHSFVFSLAFPPHSPTLFPPIIVSPASSRRRNFSSLPPQFPPAHPIFFPAHLGSWCLSGQFWVNHRKLPGSTLVLAFCPPPPGVARPFIFSAVFFQASVLRPSIRPSPFARGPGFFLPPPP